MLTLRSRGFSLIELMVAVAIVAIALSIGVPSMNQWLQNGQIRNAAESVQSGLQLTRAEAVRRNTQVRFVMMDTLENGCAVGTSGRTNWIVSLDDPTGSCDASPSDTDAPRIVQKRAANEGSVNARFEFTAGTNDISFNGTGRRTGTTTDTRILISNPGAGACSSSGGTVQCLRIEISSDGQSRVCDPALPTSNLRGCSP